MEYYSSLKRNELSSHKKTWRNCNSILLSEGSWSEKAIYCMTPTAQHSGKSDARDSKNIRGRRVWWRTPVIPVLERLRQEDHRVRGQPQLLSEVLYNLMRHCFKIKNKNIGAGV